MITQERLKEVISYDQETGIFRWRISRKKAVAGTIAGSRKERGHIIIKIDYLEYKAHRLAWLYMTGTWPKDQIDHKDYDPGNNAFSNLREATNSQNHCNKPRQSNNTSGYKGVHLDKRRGTWYANIKKHGKIKFLGAFPTAKKAHEAYVAACNIVHGEFARHQ